MKKILTVSDEVLKIKDFGARWNEQGVQLKVWAPCAIRARAAIYKEGDDLFRQELPMVEGENKVFTLQLPKEYRNRFYTYVITSAETDYEVVDPYAVASGVNSQKAMMINLEETNPQGWDSHLKPEPIPLQESVIYELHVRDFSIAASSGIKNKGKYLAFTERGSVHESISTGLDHLVELGITHVHLLPVYDFITVDETRDDQYNWGYDPILYNNPEGSYSTDPYDGRVRIKEFKQMVMALHEAGIRVVLDVVYNHTFQSTHSNFNRLAPGYFYRLDENDNFTNGSGVGNELATENPLVRQFIIDSLLYWLDEYQVDGFRFDLLALYDTETVREIVYAVKSKRPDAILYGEPWIGWESGLPEAEQFLKTRQRSLDIGLFNDDFRNALKGDNDGTETGFVMERVDMKPWIELGIAASTELPDGRKGYADRAVEVVNYASAHDNLVLWDKIEKSAGHRSYEEKKHMHRLALSIILTSLGISFLQSGTEFLRTKKGHENSYNAGDDINQLDWELKKSHMDHFMYIRDLIAFRKTSGFFVWNTQSEIEEHLKFFSAPEGCILYHLDNRKKEDCLVFHNGTSMRKAVIAPEGQFTVLADHTGVYFESDRVFSTRGERPVHVEPFSSVILVGKLDKATQKLEKE